MNDLSISQKQNNWSPPNPEEKSEVWWLKTPCSRHGANLSHCCFAGCDLLDCGCCKNGVL